MQRRKPLIVVALCVCAAAAVVQSGVFGPGPNSTTVPSTGQSFSIILTAPPDNATVGPPGTVTVQGNTALGAVAGEPINVLYVLDLSGSTDRNFMIDNGIAYVDADGDGIGSFGSPDAGDNLNSDSGDTEAGETLDGEIAGVLSLHASIGNPSNVSVGLEGFASNAAAADVGPAAGFQVFLSPPQLNAGVLPLADIPEVVRTFRSEFTNPAGGSIGKFTGVSQGTLGSSTDFKSALAVMNSTLAQFPAGSNIVFFMSDGMSNEPGPCFQNNNCGPELAAAISAHTKINTIGVGGGADPQDLQFIATQTGGTFTPVTNPSQLATVLPTITPAGIDHCTLNGQPVTLDGLGNFSAVLTCPAPGPFTITATCIASDPAATSISADVTVDCACGNGVVQPGAGEECDAPSLPTPTCDATCQRVPVCGDGFLDDPEQCDPGIGGPTCNPITCTLISCGNTLVEPGEECDPPSPGTCDDQCKQIICGNGRVDTGEDCDDGGTQDGDCCSATCGFEANGSPCPDEGNPCTGQTCNATGTCTHPPLADGLLCDDGEPCTLEDRCIAGTCTGGPGQDTDGDGDCDLAEQQCGCDFTDDKSFCLLPNRLIGRPGSLVGEVLINWYSPTVRKIKIFTDPSCRTVGVCDLAKHRCTAGKVYDVCDANEDCNQPENTCRVIVNWAQTPAHAPDLTLDYARFKRKEPVDGFTPVAAGCSRKVDITLNSAKKRVVLRVRARGTVDGRPRRDGESLRYYRLADPMPQ